MTYVIGDVHGYYNTLIKLVEQIPANSDIIFVGDLIDRGPDSAKVVEFVRKNGYKCVKGNHEMMAYTHADSLYFEYEESMDLDLDNFWLVNGGMQAILSYGVIQLLNGRPAKVENWQEPLAKLREDLEWMKNLPLYIETGLERDGKPVVVSHGSINATTWDLRNEEGMSKTFADKVLWTRTEPEEESEIFNIYGHAPRKEVPLDKHFACVDTGRYMSTEEGYGYLSAYCIETNTVIQAR